MFNVKICYLILIITGPEGLLNQALLSGNIEFAVDLCLKDGRWADALILASTGPPELIKKAQIKYFQVIQYASVLEHNVLYVSLSEKNAHSRIIPFAIELMLIKWRS